MLMMTMIRLRADPKASDGLELNWRCPYGHYVDACKQTKKTKVRNPTITVTNICKRQQL